MTEEITSRQTAEETASAAPTAFSQAISTPRNATSLHYTRRDGHEVPYGAAGGLNATHERKVAKGRRKITLDNR